MRVRLGLGALVGLGTLMLFDPGARYLVPLMPGAVVLMALAGERLLRRAGPRRRLLEPCLLAALAGWFAFTNLVHVPEESVRYYSTGMLTPVTSFDATCRHLGEQARGGDLSLMYIEPGIAEWLQGIGEELGRRCSFPDHAPDPTRPCQLLVTFAWLEEDYLPGWPAEAAGRCPDLERLRAFGDRANLRFAVIGPDFLVRHPEVFWRREDGLP